MTTCKSWFYLDKKKTAGKKRKKNLLKAFLATVFFIFDISMGSEHIKECRHVFVTDTRNGEVRGTCRETMLSWSSAFYPKRITSVIPTRSSLMSCCIKLNLERVHTVHRHWCYQFWVSVMPTCAEKLGHKEHLIFHRMLSALSLDLFSTIVSKRYYFI